MSSIKIFKEEALASCLSLEGLPQPPVENPFLSKVRAVLSAGEDPFQLEIATNNKEAIAECVSYLQKEKEAFATLYPGKKLIVDPATGEPLAILGHEHFWTPPFRYREKGEGQNIVQVATEKPAQEIIRPEVFGFLVETVSEKARYKKNLAILKARYPDQDIEKTLASPKGRDLAVQSVRDFLENTPVGNLLKIPTVDSTEEEDITPPLDFYIDFRWNVSDPLTVNPKFNLSRIMCATIPHKLTQEVASYLYREMMKPSVPLSKEEDEVKPLYRIVPTGFDVSNESQTVIPVCGELPLILKEPVKVRKIGTAVEARQVRDTWQVRARVTLRIQWLPLLFSCPMR